MGTDGRVAGKAAIITGAASGIGEATARLLAREGASVCVADVDADRGRQVAESIADDGGTAVFVRADVGVSADVLAMIERTESAFGRLDIIHNNAIWFRLGPATELDEADWDGTLNVGLKAVFLAAKHGIPVMRKTGGGVIVNTGSVHSLVSFATHTAYDAAKAGILGLTRTLAIDYGPDIRVCAVLPGAILTPLWDGSSEEDRERFAQMVPAKRLGAGRDVANAVLFLASDEASFITGTALTVDGGMLAGTG
ncbi:MAG: SDR family oxidoreductase [Spirochaetaceae bacterium]|nr:SDR family oxidoreductase [Spirochaetaceae bacterium]